MSYYCRVTLLCQSAPTDCSSRWQVLGTAVGDFADEPGVLLQRGGGTLKMLFHPLNEQLFVSGYHVVRAFVLTYIR